jgi:hypothetical protein
LPFLVYQRYIVLHYVLGGLFMHAFLKRGKLGPVAALSGALVFCLSGFASLRIVNFVMIQAYIWLPLQLLCVHDFTAAKSRLAWAGLVAAMAMSLLAGFPQVTLYCWYLVIAYWLYRCCIMRRKNCSGWIATIRQLAVRDVPKMIGTFVLVFGLCAVMVLPGAENWWRSARPHRSVEEMADTSLPYPQLLTLVVPNFFGETQSWNSPVPFWGLDRHGYSVQHNPTGLSAPGYWQYWEFGVYAGQIFWLALILIRHNWREVEDKSTVGFFLAAWLVATWFALGRYGGLYEVLRHLLPGVSLFRIPARMCCVVTFAAATLSAYSVELLKRTPQKSGYWPLFLPMAGCIVLALVLAIGGNHISTALRDAHRLSWSLHETLFTLAGSAICALAVVGVLRIPLPWARTVCLCAIPAICVVDFHHAYGTFHRSLVSPDVYFPKSDKLLTLLEDYREKRGPFRFGQIVRGRIGEEFATFRNLPYFHDFLEVPEGYNSFYLDAVAKFQNITNEEAKIALQNILVTMERDDQGKDWLGTRTNSLPRARFFTRIRQYDSRTALLGALEHGEIDWRNEAAVCAVPEVGASHGSAPDQSANANDEVQFVSETPEHYAVTYTVSQPGVIFVSQAYYPGWVADDGRTKLVEVFGAFQGLWIPEAGRGQVHVRFSPPIFRWASATTILSMAVLLSVMVFGRWNRFSASADGQDSADQRPSPSP